MPGDVFDVPLNRHRLLRIGAGCSLLIIIALSLMPDNAMVRLNVPGWIGHFCAYYATGVVLALVFPQRRNVLLIMAGLVALAGIMELGQHYSPGRTPKFSDFLAGAIGAVTGVGLGAWFRAKNAPSQATQHKHRITRAPSGRD